MISFVCLHVTFIFASATNFVLLNAAVLILFIVQYPHSCILLFLLGILVNGVCLIEKEVLFDLNNCN